MMYLLPNKLSKQLSLITDYSFVSLKRITYFSFTDITNISHLLIS